MLVQPNDLETQALRRIGGTADGQRVLQYLKRALAAQDQANRTLTDGVQLRMGQGAALALAELSGHVEGASKGALVDTRQRAGQ